MRAQGIKFRIQKQNSLNLLTASCSRIKPGKLLQRHLFFDNLISRVDNFDPRDSPECTARQVWLPAGNDNQQD